MAGYILKIVMEDTHPPVWRRVLVPEKITFGDLHEIIQILFDWDGYHMHDFRIPSDDILIEQDTGEDNFWNYGGYKEKETLVDPFFRKYKWVRYTYDFGDDWRHKIMIEKIDETYQERDVVLMKYKGDNFEEDSGGVYFSDESSCFAFDPDETKARLKNLSPLSIPNLEEPKLPVNEEERLKEIYEHFRKIIKEEAAETIQKKASPMMKKVDAWKKFCEDAKLEKLKLSEPKYTQRELLQTLDNQEASDYCKYLQIPVKVSDSKDDKTDAVCKMLQLNPEYLLYIFIQENYDALCKLSDYSCGEIGKSSWQKNAVAAALMVGLCDFQEKADAGELSFALDIKPLLKKITSKMQKDTYRRIKKFSENMEAMLRVYGMLELEDAYKIYCTLYDKNQDKTEFYRYVYWYGSFNCIFKTAYTDDGRCFAFIEDIDSQKVIAMQEKYAADMEYAVFSREDIRLLSENLANRTEWIDILFSDLRYRANIPVEAAEECLMFVLIGIMNGNTLEETFEVISEWSNGEYNIAVSAEIWKAILGIMLDLELPMLKGRSRTEYAGESNISPWSVNMVQNHTAVFSSKELHMYELPEIVQEWMYNACGFGDSYAMQKLFNFKKQENICSEEFLYLLCDSCITFGKEAEAEKLLKELENSSSAGRTAADKLRDQLQGRYDVFDDEFDDEFGGENLFPWMNVKPQVPFIRESPKIGRNDPCPCGSGKKYKKCCGK